MVFLFIVSCLSLIFNKSCVLRFFVVGNVNITANFVNKGCYLVQIMSTLSGLSDR